MANLPSELWALTLNHVSHSDLKSCRLVNRQVLPIASIYLFSKVCLQATHDSFRRAACISESPALSPYMKRLVYQVDGLQNERYAFRPEELHHFRQWLKPCGHDLALEHGDASPNGGHAHLIRKQGSEGYELQRLLAGFSSLTDIELRCSSKPCVAKVMYGDFHWPEMQYDLYPLTGRLLLILLLLATAPQNSVTSLVCDHLDWKIFERISFMWIPVYPPLNQLRLLQLHFSIMDELLVHRSIEYPNAMVTFMDATCQLEALILDFDASKGANPTNGAEALGSAILDAVRWPRLKTLSLAGFTFRKNDIVEFLRGHPSLRNLRLSQICLLGGSVASMMLGVQRHTCLDNFSLHCVYDYRVLPGGDSLCNGTCITSAIAKNGTYHPRLPPAAHLVEGETGPDCAGYRAEEWFGGDGSWSTCVGTPLQEDLAFEEDHPSMVDGR